MLCKCIFSGSGGQGSALMAKMVCLGAIKENLRVLMTQTYGIEQRGGDSTAYVIVSDEPIGNPIVENDAHLSVALSQSIYDLCFAGTSKGGKLFYNSSIVEQPKTADGFTQVGLAVSDIAIGLGSVRSANMVMLGVVLAGTGLLKVSTVEQVLTESMGAKKAAALEINIKALHAGYEAMRKELAHD